MHHLKQIKNNLKIILQKYFKLIYNFSKKSIIKTKKFCLKNKVLLLILLLSCFLIFSGLTNRALWRDEAGTAIIGENVLKYGVPTVFDGKNLVVTGYNDFNKDYISTKPPLQYYLIAGSFLIFGTNTFAARLPFAIMGVLTVFITYFVALKLTSNRKIALTSAFLLAISVFFIMHSRNARYYSMSAFFSVLSTYFYLNFIKEKKDKFKLIISCSLLFYTLPPVFLALMISFSIHYLLTLKKNIFKKENLKDISIILILVFLITFPYFLYSYVLSPPIKAESFLEIGSKNEEILNNIDLYFTTLFQIIPKILFILIPFLLIDNIIESIRKKKNLLSINKELTLILLFVFLNLIIFSLIDFNFGAQSRFMVATVPFLFIFCSIALFKISQKKISKVIILVFILFFSLPTSQFFFEELEDNWNSNYGEIKDFDQLNNPYYYRIAQDLIVTSKTSHYINAIIKEYKEPYKDGTYEIINYLNKNGNSNDTVYCTYYPLVRSLMFSTDMQIFPFSIIKTIYKEKFPDKKPDFIISGILCNNGNVDEEWCDYAKNNCKRVNITIHRQFRSWDANRPAWGVDSYYFETKLINAIIYECTK